MARFLDTEVIQYLETMEDSDDEEWAPCEDDSDSSDDVPEPLSQLTMDYNNGSSRSNNTPSTSSSSASAAMPRQGGLPGSCPPSTSTSSNSNSGTRRFLVDTGPTTPVPPFRPERLPGLHLPDCQTRADRRKFLRPVDFFKLFFTVDIVCMLCNWTNVYAEMNGERKRSLYERWTDVNVREFYRFIGLLMYMSVVKVPRFTMYWCNESLLRGLWASRFMSVWRYKCLMSFLKINDCTREDETDKLTKARHLMEYIRRKCMKLFQPYLNVSIDERMVKNKGRYAFRQYIRDKPTKWGMKLWVLADSSTGYTYNFDVYLGKDSTSSKFGLAYDVVMKLMTSLFGQGYHLFVDNFYTGVQLFKDLVLKGIRACGTVMTNRKEFPAGLKNVKEWQRKAQRGNVRWYRDGDVLALQWKDNKAVSFLSTLHDATVKDTVCRRSKENGVFKRLSIQQPQLVKDYNKNMNGVDLSDQLIGKYNCLRKTNKWWKTLFLHFLDIARVNSYILFNEFRKQNPDLEELRRPDRYSQLDFTLELIRQLGDIQDDEDVPCSCSNRKANKNNNVSTDTDMVHAIVPLVGDLGYKNCKYCYYVRHVEQKTRHGCSSCGFTFCFQVGRNCLLDAHRDHEFFKRMES